MESKACRDIFCQFFANFGCKNTKNFSFLPKKKRENINQNRAFLHENWLFFTPKWVFLTPK